MIAVRPIASRLLKLRRFVRPMDQAAGVLSRMANLPLVDVAAITGKRPILILAPHADDESLGCGGLIAQACAAGETVYVAILTDGTGSHPNSKAFPPAQLKALREQETADAVATLGLQSDRLSFLEYKDASTPLGGRPLMRAAERLAEYVRARGIATVFVVGLAADFCVAWTAIDASHAGFRTVVVDDATRAIDLNGSMEVANRAMREAGVRRVTSDRIVVR